jgi:hypothetical protein
VGQQITTWTVTGTYSLRTPATEAVPIGQIVSKLAVEAIPGAGGVDLAALVGLVIRVIRIRDGPATNTDVGEDVK